MIDVLKKFFVDKGFKVVYNHDPPDSIEFREWLTIQDPNNRNILWVYVNDEIIETQVMILHSSDSLPTVRSATTKRTISLADPRSFDLLEEECEKIRIIIPN